MARVGLSFGFNFKGIDLMLYGQRRRWEKRCVKEIT